MAEREVKKLQVFSKFGGIDVANAEVGQTIAVEEVDENGKPTNWKAVDFPDALPDDMEQLTMLSEADMLPAVHTPDGKILTDETGRIVLRY